MSTRSPRSAPNRAAKAEAKPEAKAEAKPGPKTEPTRFEAISPETCVACGRPDVTLESDYPSDVAPFSAARVRYCRACGLGAVPDAAALLAGYYERDYAAKNRRDRELPPEFYFSPTHRANSPRLQRYFTRSMRQLELLDDFAVPIAESRLLDFGSGPGYLLHLAGAAESAAFEIDPASEKYLNYLGARRFDRLDALPPAAFDAIVASHSIEHLPPEALEATLRALLASLAPEGRMLIEVPQGGHIHCHLHARQDPHTLFFTPEALVWAVRSAGGRVLYHHAFGRRQAPPRADAAYHPTGPRFFRERGGALTVICARGDV